MELLEMVPDLNGHLPMNDFDYVMEGTLDDVLDARF